MRNIFLKFIIVFLTFNFSYSEKNEFLSEIDLSTQELLNFDFQNGKIQDLKNIIDKNVNINALNAEYKTPLILASAANRVDITRLLIENGSKNIKRALLVAAENGHIDVAEFMIDNGADIYDSALLEAVENGHIDVVKFMIDKGANIYRNALLIAAENGHKDIFDLLLNSGSKKEMDWSVVMAIAARYGYKDIVKLMITKSASEFNKVISNKAGIVERSKMLQYFYKAKTSAAVGGHFDIYKLLLKKAEVSHKIRGGLLVDLSAAASSGNKKLVEFLVELIIKRGLDSDFSNPAKMAASNGHEDVLDLLIDKGSIRKDYPISDQYINFGINAARGGHKKIVQRMIDKGAKTYDSYMIAAAKGGHIDIVRWMISNGAKSFNESMVEAARGGHTEIVKLMIDNGANEFLKALEDLPMYTLSNFETIELLLENLKPEDDFDFNKAFKLSAQYGRKNLVKLFIKHGANNFKESLEDVGGNGYEMDSITSILNLFAAVKEKSLKKVKLNPEDGCFKDSLLQNCYNLILKSKELKDLNLDDKYYIVEYRNFILSDISNSSEKIIQAKYSCDLDPKFFKNVLNDLCELLNEAGIELSYNDLFNNDGKPIALSELVQISKLKDSAREDSILKNYLTFISENSNRLPKQALESAEKKLKNPKKYSDCRLLNAWGLHSSRLDKGGKKPSSIITVPVDSSINVVPKLHK